MEDKTKEKELKPTEKEEKSKPTEKAETATEKGKDNFDLKLEKTSALSTEKDAKGNEVRRKRKEDVFENFTSVSKIDISLSIRQLGLMLKSGLSLSEGIATLVDQTADNKLAKAYEQIYADIESGQTLADGMKKHPKIFTEVILSIITIGEQAGTLEKNLIFLADYIKKEYELDRKVRGALVYPLIVLVLTIFEMGGVMFFILPKLQELFQSFDNIPPFTIAVLDITEFIRNNIVYLSIGTVVTIFSINRFFKTKPGRILNDRLALRVPIIKKLTQHTIMTSFARTLAILLETGTPISKALSICAETANNSEYKDVLKQVEEKVKNGQNLAEALEEFPKYFPPTFTKMVSVGEKTGTLEVNLFYLYEYHAEEVKEMSENLTTLLEPLLLIFIGMMIGLLAIIVIGPIYQLTGSINE